MFRVACLPLLNLLRRLSNSAAREFESCTLNRDITLARSAIQIFKHHLTPLSKELKLTMEDKNKMDQKSGQPNRDQETEKKPTQGSQDVNRPGQGQQGNVQQGQRDQLDREKKPA